MTPCPWILPSAAHEPWLAGWQRLIAVLGNEDTVTGFLLGGFGEFDKHQQPNFLMIKKETTLAKIEEAFQCHDSIVWEWRGIDGQTHKRSFLHHDDIGIVLITQFIEKMIWHATDAHTKSIPVMLEISSKDPYDASKDSILNCTKGMVTAEDL
ncbi:V-type proton ATPase subunit F [Tiliqua scincoides]|uniref:V-type proton ATPase subunit F n=1 Tax=Tiliqua scincoides TaxID=71010 RepID=UPI0034637BAC